MTAPASTPHLEDVLEWFALEADAPGVLARYLRDYPQFSRPLVDLSYELAREIDETAPLPPNSETKIATAWQRYRAAVAQPASNPFAGKSPSEMRAIAEALSVPRQVLIAFREGRVLIQTVPERFMRRMAEALSTRLDNLRRSLAGPPLIPARQFKADTKPARGQPVSFEQLLLDAQVPEERRSELLAEDH